MEAPSSCVAASGIFSGYASSPRWSCRRCCSLRTRAMDSVSASITSPSMRPPSLVQSDLVLMRHGESMWNELKLFTGDVDIPLTEKGLQEALAGGRAISEIDFDIIFTSRLVRSKQTALIAMTQSKFKRVPVLIRGGFYGKGKAGDDNRLKLREAAARALEHASCQMVPVYADPALNERSYGDLQGLSKEVAIQEFGAATVTKWRRSFDTRPPNGESLQIVTALPYAYAFDGAVFAECCVLPPLDGSDDNPLGIPSGFTAKMKRKESMVRGDGDKLDIMPLGAGNEVGRSCVHMTYKGKTVLFDCGIHPGYSGIAALPYFDAIDPSTIDVLLVTHFHLDHCASLPYFLEKTTFKGRVFMTHATKAIYKLLLSDFVKISKVSVEDMLYDEQDINRTMDKIEVIDFHQTMEVNGIRFWCYTAGHVLGAAMFMVDIVGVRVLYTDVCIIESTYGVQIHQPRMVRQKRFTETVAHTVSHGGRVLIPAFALGRAQELLLILDEYWEAHPELQHIPIYYASPLAKRCMTVYQTYINGMNDKIKSQLNVSNPFEFKHISPLKSIEQFEDVGPSVVMASPGGLQSGLSRQLFDRWCQDKKNSCVIPGYVVEGTLAKTIINEPKEVTLMNGLVVPLHMHVHYISFSAHADFSQTSAFLNELKPPNIILVHGEANEMGRLKAKLLTQFADQNVKVLSPKNCQTVEMFFKGEKIAKAVGKLAEKTPKEGDPVNGLLVKKGFTYQLMAPEDLHVYTQLSRGSVMQRQSVPYKGAFTVLRHRLQQMYESVETMLKSEFPSLRIHDKVTIVHEGTDYVILHWVSDPVSDMVADSIIAMILKLDSQSLYGMVSNGHRSKEARLEKDEIKIVHSLLASLFGDVKLDEQQQMITVTVDGVVATIDRVNKGIDCNDEGLKEGSRLHCEEYKLLYILWTRRCCMLTSC